MKKRYWTDSKFSAFFKSMFNAQQTHSKSFALQPRFKLILVSVVVVLLLFCTASCKSMQTERNNQIVATAIKLAELKKSDNLFADALDVYERAYEKTSDYRLLYNMALCYAESGDFSTAEQLAKNGIAQFPDVTEFRSVLSGYLFSEEKYDEAVATGLEYLNAKPDDKAARILFMKACLAAEYSDEAYNQAIYLWENKEFTKDVVNVLYAVNPDEWKIVYSVFN